MNRREKSALLFAIILTMAMGLLVDSHFGSSAVGKNRLVVATTTSTVDSGLLSYLKPYFDSKYNLDLTWLRLGSGQAVEVASRGDADILLVHDRSKEDSFVDAGNGLLRITVMYNDFVLIGPASDPAGAIGQNATVAMARIATSNSSNKAVFISRGDNSGTHSLEKRLWSEAGIENYVGAQWYLSAGAGMADVIRIANEMGGYTIADRATYLALKLTMKENLGLVILCEKDPALLNPYGIVLLNSTRYPNIHYDWALDFLLFLVSDEGQSLISNYTIGGERVFFPIYGRPETIGLPSEEAAVSYINYLLSVKGVRDR
ncbi:MAG: substrate-binding domain-containing protein [Candidatus Methanomethylicia archaeon]|nr:substrate-binding domain-containing protein [Candidatus Methanomethylicia archaeon]